MSLSWRLINRKIKGTKKMTTDEILKRIDELIGLGNEVLSTVRHRSQGLMPSVDNGKFRGFRSASLSFLERIFGADQTYYKEFINHVKINGPSYTKAGINILQAAKAEIEGGWLFTIKGLVSAEIFADFIEMAEHLLQEGYKDAAAVMVGSILEEHLRKLCEKNDIPATVEKNDKIITKRADVINHELAKAEVYNKLDMKQITSWLDLRNKAAHGKYTEYSKKQVALLLQGVTDFMSRVPI